MDQRFLEDMQEKMTKSLDSFSTDLAKVRTGRAHAQLLDHIKVESYGAKMPLPQVATVSVEGARSLLVSAWDRSQVAAVEKAIRQSDMGLNPQRNGDVLRIALPELTQERRQEMVKFAKELAEGAKVSLRNHRRAAMTAVKQAVKDKELTEDDEKRLEGLINKQTEQFVEKVSALCAKKETELQAV